MKIRLASEKDAEEILEIYKPFIINTPVTFEYEVPKLSEFKNRIINTQKKYPYLVCGIDGNIAAYAYASSYGKRAAFDWSVELSIYINPKYHRKNIGKAMYTCLLKLLKLQGFYNAYALITSPNPQSEGFHTSFGFKRACVLPKMGYKFGKWHDLAYYELAIADHKITPKAPKTIDEIKSNPEFSNILSEAAKTVKL